MKYDLLQAEQLVFSPSRIAAGIEAKRNPERTVWRSTNAGSPYGWKYVYFDRILKVFIAQYVRARFGRPLGAATTKEEAIEIALEYDDDLVARDYAVTRSLSLCGGGI